MIVRYILAVIAIFVAWAVLDIAIHGVILGPTYAQQPELWRPMEEMKMGLMYVVTLVSAAAFAGIYGLLVSPKSIGTGLKYGFLFGIAFGFSMGFGTYSVMPIPFHMAVVWCLGTVVELLIAGAVVGAIMKPAPRDAAFAETN